MTISVEDIRQLATYYKDELYGRVRSEQNTDESYYEDSFPVPEIVAPHVPLRSGLARKIIDNPAEQMITRNPQVFVETGKKEVNERLSSVLNQWLNILRRQNPNPFKESVKNPLLLGETYLYLVNEDGLDSGDFRGKLPVRFIVPDSRTVYASSEEDENGVPSNVLVICDRTLDEIEFLYPEWKRSGDNLSKKVKWLAYWDKDVRYFEADQIPVLKGDIQENIFGTTPFIRRYSGFGRRNASNDLSSLIVSELRGSRGMLKEECLVRSDIASSLHLYAHPRFALIIPQGQIVDTDKLKAAFDFSPGTLSVLPLPEGSKFDPNAQLKPVPEVFAHLAEVNARIERRHPMVNAGQAFGSSGRQQDMMGTTVMHRYETILENTETMFATAIEMALKMCKTLDYVPNGLKAEDVEREEIKCNVVLRAEDPLERDRKVTLGDRLWAQGSGSIDLTTFHTEYIGYTQEESQEIIAKMLADKVTLYNPDVAQVMGLIFAEEAGMGEWLEKAKMQNTKQAEDEKALQKMPAPTSMQRVKGETMTETGFNMMDEALRTRGARKPPVAYTRGG